MRDTSKTFAYRLIANVIGLAAGLFFTALCVHSPLGATTSHVATTTTTLFTIKVIAMFLAASIISCIIIANSTTAMASDAAMGFMANAILMDLHQDNGQIQSALRNVTNFSYCYNRDDYRRGYNSHDSAQVRRKRNIISQHLSRIIPAGSPPRKHIYQLERTRFEHSLWLHTDVCLSGHKSATE